MSVQIDDPKDLAERLFPPLERRGPIAWDWDAAEQAIRARDEQTRRALTAAFLAPDGGGGFEPTGDSWGDDMTRIRAVLDKLGGPL